MVATNGALFSGPSAPLMYYAHTSPTIYRLTVNTASMKSALEGGNIVVTCSPNSQPHTACTKVSRRRSMKTNRGKLGTFLGAAIPFVADVIGIVTGITDFFDVTSKVIDYVLPGFLPSPPTPPMSTSTPLPSPNIALLLSQLRAIIVNNGAMTQSGLLQSAALTVNPIITEIDSANKTLYDSLGKGVKCPSSADYPTQTTNMQKQIIGMHNFVMGVGVAGFTGYFTTFKSQCIEGSFSCSECAKNLEVVYNSSLYPKLTSALTVQVHYMNLVDKDEAVNAINFFTQQVFEHYAAIRLCPTRNPVPTSPSAGVKTNPPPSPANPTATNETSGHHGKVVGIGVVVVLTLMVVSF